MTFVKIILLSMALSVDSFAVSMSGAVSMGRINASKAIGTASILGIIQTAFFMTGCLAGGIVSVWISQWGRYIGFALLLYVAGTMIAETAGKKQEKARDFGSIWKIIVAAVATSIDAIAVGTSFGLTGIERGTVLLTSLMIFIATVAFALSGMYCGNAIGRRFGKSSGYFAGIILIIIGIGLLR